MLSSTFSNFHERSFFHAYTLHTVIWFTLSKHMLGSQFSNFHRSFFFSCLHSPHMFRDSLSIQLFGLHSPSTCLVQNFQIFTGDNFFHTYTLQAHVRFKIFKFSQEIIFSCLHSPHMFRDSLSIQLFCLHSPSTCSVQNFQIFTRDHFFMLTLSTHVSGFTLHTVIWFTLSKHMLSSKFSNFHERSFFHAYTLHTVIWFTLSKHMLGSQFSNFHRSCFFSCLHSPHMFRDSLSIQLFGLHSPSTCLVQNFQIFTGDNFFHTYTLQAHVRFKIFKFSQEIIFSCLHSPHMFRDSLSIQLFCLHSPSTCSVQNFQIFTRDHFFMLTLSTHVSGFTLHTVIWFTLSKHMLGSKFSREIIFSCLHSPHVSGFTLHTDVTFQNFI